MRGKIALEEHVSTPENNRLWDSSGEAGRNGTEYMKDVEFVYIRHPMLSVQLLRLVIRRIIFPADRWCFFRIIGIRSTAICCRRS